MTPRLRIGIDLGGTKIAGIALARDGKALARSRVATPRGDYDATLDAICALIDGLEHEAGMKGTIGLAVPGSLSPATGRMQNANSTWLNGRALDQDLERRLGRGVRIANDANCFALSEATDGAGAGYRSVFGVILGTGCGGGLVINGQLVDGPHGIGGEWGHNPLPWPGEEEFPGPECWCGRRGCIETWVSGPALAADHRRATGRDLDAQVIAAAAQEGDRYASAALERHCDRLARSLAHVVNIFDPEIIVLGGGLSQMGHLYERLPGLIRPHVFAQAAAVRIAPPRHGAASGVRGAAWLWNETEG
ncbi:MAG: ROK family protein [Methyloligellaceae bacterium]